MRSETIGTRAGVLPAAAWLGLWLVAGVAATASADPCCVSQLCEDLTPADCSSQMGIEAYCTVASACGAVTCNATMIADIRELKATKINGFTDIWFAWLPDANADSYDAWWVTDKTLIPAGPGNNRVRTTDPMSTIAAVPHDGAAAPGPAGEVFFYEVVGSCTTATSTGACCGSVGCSDDTTRAACEGAFGTYLGDGTTCTPGICDDGACCSVANGCEDAQNQTDCEAGGGVFAGDGTTCATEPCPGACCPGFGTCMDDQTRSDCEATGGTYEGILSECSADPCPPRGGCCLSLSCVDDATETACTDAMGTWLGDGITCAVGDCGLGACCTTGSCQDDQKKTDCEGMGGTYAGDNSTCAMEPCPGACCPGFGLCMDDQTRADCDGIGGTYEGILSECVSNPCPPRGACCISVSCVDDATEAACDGVLGTYGGDGSKCSDIPPPC